MGDGRREMGAVCFGGVMADREAQLAQRPSTIIALTHIPPLVFVTVQYNTVSRCTRHICTEQRSYLAIRRRAAQTLPSSSMDPVQWRASVATERGRAERPAAASREPSAGATLTTSAGPCQAPRAPRILQTHHPLCPLHYSRPAVARAMMRCDEM